MCVKINLLVLLLLLQICALSNIIAGEVTDRWPITYTSTKHRDHDFSSGVRHIETLSWAVKIGVDSSSSLDLDVIADAVAVKAGLQNRGQIGALKGHYLFTHPVHDSAIRHLYRTNLLLYNQKVLHSGDERPFSDRSTGYSHEDTLPWVNRSQIKNTRHIVDGNLTDSEWLRLKEDSFLSLDGHPRVEWHQQQLIRPRHKRAIPFHSSDPSARRWSYRTGRSLTSVPRFNDPAFSKQWHLVSQHDNLILYFL